MTTETLPLQIARARRTERARAIQAWTWIALPCGLAAVLVLYELGTRSLWLDEAASVSIASQHGAALWHAIAHDGGNMLGYYLFLHVIIGALGDTAAVIRMPSAVAAVVTVALVASIARRMLDRRAALTAGLLGAVNLPLIFWGQDARAYAPMMVFVCASFLAFIELVDETGARARWAWAAYVAATVLAAYMSFVALLVVPAQLVAWLRNRRRPPALLSAVAAVGACCVPLAVLAAQRGSEQLFWVPPPNLKGIGQAARWLTSSGMPPNFHPTGTAVAALILALALIAVAIVAVAAQRGSWVTFLVLCWLVVPLVLSIGESLAGQPILLYRNSLVSLPAVTLLLAWTLMRPGVPRWVGWSGLSVLVALRALQLVPSYGVSPENWKGATRFVEARARPGDCVAFFPSDGRMPFSYYARRPALRSVLPEAPWSASRPFVEQYTMVSAARLVSIESACPRLWLVASHYGARNGSDASQRNYARYMQLREALQRRYRAHVSTTFGWASPVRVLFAAR